MTDHALLDLAAALASGRPELDAASHTIWRNKEIIAPVLREVVSEFSDASVEEICTYIDESSILSLPGYVSDIPERIEELNEEFKSKMEKPLRYDIHFKAKNPKLSNQESLVLLHLDYEIQNTYHPKNPSYPVVKRGIYYSARELSAQLGPVTESTNYAALKKVYSIWLCLFDIPGKLQNTISHYHLTRDDIFGTCDEPVQDYDLIDCVIIRSGANAPQETLFEYIDGLYSGDMNIVQKYIGTANHPKIRKEVEAMTFTQALCYDSLKKGYNEGHSKGEASMLVKMIDSACSNHELNWTPETACKMLGENFEEYLAAKEKLASGNQ